MIQMASQLGDKLHDTLEQAGELGRTAGEKLDEARRNTADALTGSAASIRDAGQAIGAFADKASGKLDSTAGYVRSLDSARILFNLRQAVRQHPACYVSAATAAGFFLGFAVRKAWKP